MEQSSGKKLWIVVAVLVVLIAGAASAAYYFISTATEDDIVTETNSSSTEPTPVTDVGVVPTSGIWNFIMTATTSTLSGTTSSGRSCSEVSPTFFQTGGEVELLLNTTGTIALLDIDVNAIWFNGSIVSNASGYESASYPFVTPGGGGTVYYDFVANTVDTIVGGIHWTSEDCSAEYPFTMELIQPGLGLDTNAPLLLSGDWNMAIPDIDDLACDPTMAGFTALPIGPVTIDYVVDLDTGNTDPGSITLSGAETNIYFDVVTNTNVYQQISDPVDIGAPVDAAGDLLLDFTDESYTAGMSLVATSETTATGTITIQSSSGCSFTVPFTLTAV